MTNRFIGIDYSEVDNDPAYKGITITTVNGKEPLAEFRSGDPEKDFLEMMSWAANNTPEEGGRYMFTSSVDHFCMDVPGYKWTSDEYGERIVNMTPKEKAEDIKEREARQKEEAEEEAILKAATQANDGLSI
jgi:hypothetical protein